MNSLKFKIINLLNKAAKGLLFFYFFFLEILGFKKNEASDGRRQTEFDKKLVYSFSKSKIPSLRQLKYLNKFLSKKESKIFYLSLAVFIISFSFLGVKFYLGHRQIVPARGGEYTEGVVGSPKYINPLYANFSDVDSDISSLVFSSLLKRGENGQLINDLAENYKISEDGKIYTFKIKKDVRWHNGSALTVDDILFTFQTIKDSSFKSSLKDSFRGVETEKVDDNTIKFILSESYAAFAELLTFGVLPQDLWYQISPSSASLAELNLKPAGSGPFKFKSFAKDKNGQIKLYNLEVNDDYYGPKPNIKNLNFKFFGSFEEATRALNENSVDGISYLPRNLTGELTAKNYLNFFKLKYPQIIAIFFNPKNNDILSEKSVRQSLAFAAPKEEIVKKILKGEGRLIAGPILPENFAYNQENKKYDFNKDEAVKILDGAGWKAVQITAADLAKAGEEKVGSDEKIKKEAEIKLSVGEGRWRRKGDKFLKIKLTVVGNDENILVAEAVKRAWEEIGAKVEIENVMADAVGGEVVKPRNFEALLYGQVTGSDPDSYAFWHSSQISENGLNISNFSNKEVDVLLEDGRLSLKTEERKEKYRKFQEIITNEAPAIFLYSPFYIYAQNKKIKGFNSEIIFSPKDRFSGISGWYVKTKKKFVW